MIYLIKYIGYIRRNIILRLKTSMDSCIESSISKIVFLILNLNEMINLIASDKFIKTDFGDI